MVVTDALGSNAVLSCDADASDYVAVGSGDVASVTGAHRAAPLLRVAPPMHPYLAQRQAEAAAKALQVEQQQWAASRVWCSPRRRDEAKEAAISFDNRQRSRKNETKSALGLTAEMPDEVYAGIRFDCHCRDLFRNRYFVPEKGPPPPKRYAQRSAGAAGQAGQAGQAVKRPWRLQDSIWAGRQFRGGEDRGFYDQDSIRDRAIKCDLSKAIGKGLLVPYLMQNDASTQHLIDRKQASTPEAAAEFDQTVEALTSSVEDQFIKHARLFFMVFDYYASLGANDNIFHISHLGYDRMNTDCGFRVKGSKHSDVRPPPAAAHSHLARLCDSPALTPFCVCRACQTAHLDIIFVLVNMSTEKANKASVQETASAQTAKAMKRRNSLKEGKLLDGKLLKHDDHLTLTRAELVQCLCRIAVARYILTPKTPKTPKAGKTSVADAVDELFKTLRLNASREVCQNSTQFRAQNCYTEETDSALRVHELALRLLFTKYCKGDGKDEKARGQLQRQHTSAHFVASSSKMLSPGAWICLCRDLNLIGYDLSIEEARIIFMWSRMRVVDEDDPVNRQRIENLTFWGFLEAIVRVAQTKAMPTDDEVAATSYKDGGDFLLGLERDDHFAYRGFVEANDRGWWMPLRQPIHKKLTILLSLMIHVLAASLKRWHQDGSLKQASSQMVKSRELAKKSQQKAVNRLGDLEQMTVRGQEDGLLEGITSLDGGMSPEALARLGSALDEQSGIQDPAATFIQAVWRGRLARKECHEERQAAPVLQRHMRGMRTRLKLEKAHPRLAKAAIAVRKATNAMAMAHRAHKLASVEEAAVGREAEEARMIARAETAKAHERTRKSLSAAAAKAAARAELATTRHVTFFANRMLHVDSLTL